MSLAFNVKVVTSLLFENNPFNRDTNEKNGQYFPGLQMVIPA